MKTDKGNVLKGYYHCIDCDSLFEAEFDSSSRVVLCSKCGNSPLIKRIDDVPDAFSNTPEEGIVRSRKGIRRSMTTRQRANRKLLYFAGLTALVILGGVFFMKKPYVVDVASLKDKEALRSERENEIAKDKELNYAAIDCNAIMGGFVKVKNGFNAAQFVYDSVGLESEIKHFYRKNPIFVVGEPKVTMSTMRYIRDIEPIVLGAIFKDEAGKDIDVSFIKDKGKYKIDWASYVRYNRGSLEEFLNQSRVLEADFRLYMRVLDMRGVDVGNQLTLIFYPPRTNSENEFDTKDVTSLKIPADSEMAAFIMATLNDENPMDKDYRKFITEIDPKGYHRVRVRLRLKHNEGEESSLEIVDFLANDWYGVDIKNLGIANELKFIE